MYNNIMLNLQYLNCRITSLCLCNSYLKSFFQWVHALTNCLRAYDLGWLMGRQHFPWMNFVKSHCSKVRTTGWIVCLHVHTGNTFSRSNFTSQVAFGSDFSGKWDVATLGPWNGSKEMGFSCWSCVWRSAKELCWKYADEVNSTPFVYIISSSIWSEGYKELWGWLDETAS